SSWLQPVMRSCSRHVRLIGIFNNASHFGSHCKPEFRSRSASMTQRIAILLRNLNRSSNLSKSKSDHLRLLQARDRECTRSMLHQDGTRLHAEQELIH